MRFLSTSLPARESANGQRFWRVIAVLAVCGLFYIGHGLSAQRGPRPSFGVHPGSDFFSAAAFAGDGNIEVIRGDVSSIVTTTDDGQTLLLWMFGPTVNQVPTLDRVVRFVK